MKQIICERVRVPKDLTYESFIKLRLRTIDRVDKILNELKSIYGDDVIIERTNIRTEVLEISEIPVLFLDAFCYVELDERVEVASY